jgi:ribosomal protein S14
MTTLPEETDLTCECCGSKRGTTLSAYFNMDLCRRCWREAADRVGALVPGTLALSHTQATLSDIEPFDFSN